jgi:aminopeptidase-like protein
VLLSAHICHPSLANDNCSGLALLTLLARALGRRPTRYTYRFVFAPGTIGAITWLARNEAGTSASSTGSSSPASATAAPPPTRRAAAAMH